MNEMIERVARAICREERQAGDSDAVYQAVEEACWFGYVDFARAAIRAMREPTATMVEHAARTMHEAAGTTVAWSTLSPASKDFVRRLTRASFVAAVDAALTP